MDGDSLKRKRLIISLKEAMETDPSIKDAIVLARLLMEDGAINDARKLLDTVLEGNSEDADVSALLSTINELSLEQSASDWETERAEFDTEHSVVLDDTYRAEIDERDLSDSLRQKPDLLPTDATAVERVRSLDSRVGIVVTEPAVHLSALPKTDSLNTSVVAEKVAKSKKQRDLTDPEHVLSDSDLHSIHNQSDKPSKKKAGRRRKALDVPSNPAVRFTQRIPKKKRGPKRVKTPESPVVEVDTPAKSPGGEKPEQTSSAKRGGKEKDTSGPPRMKQGKGTRANSKEHKPPLPLKEPGKSISSKPPLVPPPVDIAEVKADEVPGATGFDLLEMPLDPLDFDGLDAEPESVGERRHSGTLSASLRRRRNTALVQLKRFDGLAPWALGLMVLLIMVVFSVGRHDSEVSRLGLVLESARLSLQGGDHQTRIALCDELARSPSAGGVFLASGQFFGALLGRPSLRELEAEVLALRARLEAERLVLFMEVEQEKTVREILYDLAGGAQLTDLQVVHVLLLIHRRDYTLASERLRSESKRLSDTGDGDWLAAVLANARQDLEPALGHVTASLRKAPHHPHAGLLAAQINGQMGRHGEALSLLERLITRQPSNVRARIIRNRIRIAAGKRPVEARRELEQMISNPGLKLSAQNRAEIFEARGLESALRGDQATAEQFYRSALLALPGDPRFIQTLADLLLKQFRLKEARELLTQESNSELTFVDVKARIKLLEGKPEEARSLIENTKERTSTSNEILGRAIIHQVLRLGLGHPESKEPLGLSIRSLEAAMKADRRSMDARVLLSLARALSEPTNKRLLKSLKRHRSAKAEEGGKLKDSALPFWAYGIALESRGRLRTASREFSNAIELNKADFRPHFDLCRVLARRLKAKEALSACRAALVNSSFLPARIKLAEIAQAHRDHGAVIEALESIADDGLSAAGWRMLIRAYLKTGRSQTLVRKLEEHAMSLDEGVVIYAGALQAEEKGVADRARTEMARAANRWPSFPRVQVDYARMLMSAGLLQTAHEVLEKAVESGKEPLAALELARLAVLLSDWQRALKLARLAETRASRSLSHPRVRADALAIQALALAHLGGRRNTRKGLRLTKAALRIEPDMPTTLMAQGMLLKTLRKWKAAETAIRRLVQVDPDNAQAHYRLGVLLERQRKKKSQAFGAYERALELDSEGMWGRASKKALFRLKRRR